MALLAFSASGATLLAFPGRAAGLRPGDSRVALLAFSASGATLLAFPGRAGSTVRVTGGIGDAVRAGPRCRHDGRAAWATERRCAVLDPAELYRLEPDAPTPPDPVLVLVLDGFVDAGAAARLAVESLLAPGPGRRVARFDVDQLVDYRSRRPPLRFETDRWTHYAAPELDLVALADSAGTGFLLLAGPEPDTQWERFAAAVEQLVVRFDVRLVVNMTGIPMAVPHTRPIGVTVHGTRPELTEGHEALFANAEVPGSAVALTEYRLGEAGHAAMGFAVHVPHYLARAEYPQAARVLVDHLAVATGLYLSTEALTAAAERAEREITEQVAGSEEVAQVVEALERQYDTVVSASPEGARERSGAGLGGELPSADELAAEVERFLAGHDGPPDGPAAPDDADPDEPAAPPDGPDPR